MNMPFPLSYRGKIECRSYTGVASLLDRMSEVLRSEGLQNVFVWSSGISFGGTAAGYSPTQSAGGNHLTIINEGEVDISASGDELVVSYTLHFWAVAVVVTLCALGVFVLLGLGEPTPSLPVRAALSVALWLLMMGGGYLFAASSFESMIRRAL
jgi:hypothetical protein